MTKQSSLQWLLCSQNTLGTKLFLVFVSSSANKERSLDLSVDALLDICFNLIVQDAELDVFRFSHLSVREYFEEKAEFEPDLNYAFASEYCLGAFTSRPNSFTESVLPTSLMEKYEDSQFVTYINEYACLYWTRHVCKSRILRLQEPLKTLFTSFMIHERKTAPAFARWN